MKPLVSSIVALAIAIAPFAAYAAPTESASHKPTTSKVSKHHKKSEPSSKKSDKKLEPVVHHAHNADVSGAGHSEPKADKSEKGDKGDKAIVPASLSSKSHKDKAHKGDKPEGKASEMPKLPDPKAEKSSKSGRERSHKSTDKKSDDSSDKDGQRERDEDFADLVARIRGKHEAKDDAKSEPRDSNKARRVSDRQPACTKDPVEIIRGPEIDKFQLTKCDGTVAPLAVEHLSIAIRPGSAARPIAPIAELAKKAGDELAPRVHRIDPGLALRIQALADHFGKPGAPIKMSIVSGMRPTSIGSMHALGRAVDFRIEGQKNEDIVAFCKTLNDTGCGYYPNSSFVHLDVRDSGKGHVSWIDMSGPGETPKYVSSWPPKKDKNESLEPASATETIPDADGMPEVEDNHP